MSTTEEESKYYEFITEYKYQNKKYSDSIFANSYQDAENKLKSKKETEIILGHDPTNPIIIKE